MLGDTIKGTRCSMQQRHVATSVSKVIHMRIEVLVVVSMKPTVFRDVNPCSLVGRYSASILGKGCLHLQRSRVLSVLKMGAPDSS